jgi:hypothetical protein
MDRKLSSGVVIAFLIIAVVALYLTSCSPEVSPEPPVTEVPPVEEPDPAIEEFERRRQDYEDRLAKMPVAEISQEMVKDSQARTEPFNSPAAREIRKRARQLEKDGQPVEPLAKELAATLKAPDASSHIGLLTVHKVSPATYYALKPEFRYQVLMDALSKAQVMNAWGVPDSFLTQPAARAIICEGPAIEKYLYPVLDVPTKTEVFGSSEVQRFKEDDPNVYQVKDYALALIFAARGDTSFAIPGTRTERDAYIDSIRKEGSAGGRAAPSRAAEGRGPVLPKCPPRGDATQTPAQNAPAVQTSQRRKNKKATQPCILRTAPG